MGEMAGTEAAIAILAQRGAVVTPLAQRVLATICNQAKPVGAYEIADQLGRRANGRPMTPNSVYRTLKILVDCGAVQHIESQRTYIARGTAYDGSSLLCVCDGCGGVDRVAVPGVAAEIDAAASDRGFHLLRQIVEATGLCSDCVDGHRALSS